MKSIGITGGIGSGKTTVCKIFEVCGYKVYYADERARYLMVNHPGIIREVKSLFGEEAYLGPGTLNRAYIGGIVFKDKEKLNQLNGIVHPRTFEDYAKWEKETSIGYTKSFLLKEAAILFESGSYKYSDAVIEVYAPKQIRLHRVTHRDGHDTEAVLDRMDKQWTDLKKIQLSDQVIFSDGQHSLIYQVLEAIRFFEQVFG